MQRSEGRPLTPEERVEVWRLYKAGKPIKAIGRLLGRPTMTVHHELMRNGGFTPRVRRRSRLSLTLMERETISRGVAQGESLRTVARRLRRSPSTISREIGRHGGLERYRATEADVGAWESALRPKPCRLAVNRRLQRLVVEKLTLDWSPEQIAGWLRMTFAGEEEMQVSHETIYRSLFVQTRGALKKELQSHLRRKRTIRRSRTATARGAGRGQIVDAVSIRERPAEIEDRAVPGHWEGDLLVGSRHSQIATLVERQSRFVMLVKLKDRGTDTVVSALIRRIRALPNILKGSLTWDRGLELAKHRTFTVATDVQVYFCDPSSPWQRGSNENTNGLLRQYFPKGTDLTGVTQIELNKIARRLNARPRETLGWETPASRLLRGVASIS